MTIHKTLDIQRRGFLQQAGACAAFFTVPGLFAEVLADQKLPITTSLTEGPYYPDRMPLDTDNDLLIINDATTPAIGEITYLSGRVLSSRGEPVRNAFVEIWQCDARASYNHSRGRNPETGYDSHFQGYGRFLTAADGRYYFRTIKPVPYTLGNTFRTPHIHIAVSRNGQRLLTTQILIRNHPDNKHDAVLYNIRDPQARETLMADFTPLPDSTIGEHSAHFDLILGITAMENQSGQLQGGIGRSQWRRLFGG